MTLMESEKVDILVFAAHPDDAELACAGTILAHIAMGKKVGIVDLTRGELGTRGTPEIRSQESAQSSKILKLSFRENLGFADGFFVNDAHHQRAVAAMIRRFQPEIVLANAVRDRHPDHGRASKLVSEACFIAGLAKVELTFNDSSLPPWRPKNIYHYIQSSLITPDIVVDVTDYWEEKMQAIRAFGSQFFDPNSKEPQTFISSPQFLQLIEARAIEFGQPLGFKYGEGFVVEKTPGVKSLFDLH